MAPTQTRKVQGFVILTLVFRQEGRRWLGECVELGTATYSNTLKRTHAELVEMVELHLNTLEQTGERQRFFDENGIKFYADHQQPKKVTQDLPVDESIYVHPHPFPILGCA